MRSLETRVHGLELTLDEISFDLARSTGRLSYTEPADALCCKLPGADFLTSKLWKKMEIQHSNTRISSSPFVVSSHMNGNKPEFRRSSCNRLEIKESQCLGVTTSVASQHLIRHGSH